MNRREVVIDARRVATQSHDPVG